MIYAGSQGFTHTINAGDSVTVLEEYGIRLLAIKCRSTSLAAGTIKGGDTDPFNSRAASVAIPIPIGEGLTIESQNGNLSGYVITAPADCILDLIGQCA